MASSASQPLLSSKSTATSLMDTAAVEMSGSKKAALEQPATKSSNNVGNSSTVNREAMRDGQNERTGWATPAASSHGGESSRSRRFRYDDSDTGYTQEIARRAVARAALHLGVRKCSPDVLDTLSDALIGFLEKVSSSETMTRRRQQ